MQIYCSVSGVFLENTYFIIDEQGGTGIIVDPGLGAIDKLQGFKPEITWEAIFLTHAHFDHILGLNAVYEYTKAPIYLHKDDLFLYNDFIAEAAKFGYKATKLPAPDYLWTDGQTISLGLGSFKIIHTPGHTPGGVCIQCKKGVFTGDTLMHLEVGRTDWFGSFEQLQDSIAKKLFTLNDAVVIYPGHHQQSTIGIEKQSNQQVFI